MICCCHLLFITVLLSINMLLRGFHVSRLALRSTKIVPRCTIMKALFSSIQLSIFGENTLVEKVYGQVSTRQSSTPQFTKGQIVEVRILHLSSMGATVGLGNTNKKGMILANELDVFHEGKSIKEYLRNGDTIDGFISSIDEQGRVLVSLRPSVEKRITLTRDRIMTALELSPTGELPIGDKSSPEEIAQFFHGVSKSDFKHAVGALMKEGLVKPGATAIALYSAEELRERQNQIKPFVEKPHFLQTDPSLCIFIGNLPQSVGEGTLTSEVEAVTGPDSVAEVRLVRNSTTQASRGFAFVEFRSQHSANAALRALRGTHMFGRPIRVNRASKRITVIKVPSGTPHSVPLSELRSDSKGLVSSSSGGDTAAAAAAAGKNGNSGSRRDDDSVVAEAVRQQTAAVTTTKTTTARSTPSTSRNNNDSGSKSGAAKTTAATAATNANVASVSEDEEYLEEGVDGVLSPEEALHYASLIENEQDFDPERDYFVVEDDYSTSGSSSSGGGRGGTRVTKIRSGEDGQGEVGDAGGERFEEEPEDYNDFNLYQPREQTTASTAKTAAGRRQSKSSSSSTSNGGRTKSTVRRTSSSKR